MVFGGRIDAIADVTVVFVRGKLFAFSLERDFLDRTIDWRRLISPAQTWRHMTLPESLQDAVVGYMNALLLDYGRLDFLLDKEDRYWFCEVNPNGQFAWLDLENEHGLLSTVADEISSCTARHAIPKRHPLAEVHVRLSREASAMSLSSL